MCPTITILADDLVEGEEEFTVFLTLVTTRKSLSLGNNVTKVTLSDDDGMYSVLNYTN